MAAKQRFLDLWIIDTNTVYKEVPFTVVTDWLQQGRLLEDDKAKPSGTAEWQRLGDLADFQPYLLRPDPHRPEDQAEALEPVGVEFRYHKRHDEEDDDVDMIPLIDVSLVLLVFFMMTASAGVLSSPVPTPATEYGDMVAYPEGLRVDIDLDADGNPVYAIAVGDRPAEPDERDLHALPAALDRLRARVNKMSGTTELVINAHKNLKAKYTRELLLALRTEPFRSRITDHRYGVSQRQP